MSSNAEIGTFLFRDLHEYNKISCYKLYAELFDKKEKIIKYTKIPEKQLSELLYLVLKRIDFINENQISQESWNQAKILTDRVDVEDVSFVALTIESNGVLWTGDKKLYKGLKKQGFNRVVNFHDLKKLIKGK